MHRTDPLLLLPDWPRPAGVRAAITTRRGGWSQGPYDSFNLGDHVGDDTFAVQQNRALLSRILDLPAAPRWLRQVHGTNIVTFGTEDRDWQPADGAVSFAPAVVLAVLSADCLPVLAVSADGQRLGAFHAGWRGLAAGILEQGIAALGVAAEQILVYLGPAIGPDAFVVGGEVRACFLAADPDASWAFRPGYGDRYYADLYALARMRLARLGVTRIYGGNYCTVRDESLFFSHRRDGVCGRMASLIWREATS